MMRLVQAGSGSRRPLVVVYHLNEKADADLIDAVGPTACVVNITVPQAEIGSYAGMTSFADVVAWARAATGEDFGVSAYTLAGFSGGYLGVESHLRAGEHPDAVVVADAIQSPRPGSPEAVRGWIEAAQRARNRDAVFLASHSTQGQTQLLSTGETLRLITGFPLDAAGTLDDPATSSDGNLIVLSYAGNDHQAQGYVVLPRMLRLATALLAENGPKWVNLLGFFAAMAISAYVWHMMITHGNKRLGT